MTIKSDVTVDASKFDRSSVSEKTRKFNESLIRTGKAGPRWYEIGAAEYRKLRWEGKTAFPKPVVLNEGVNTTIPSRDKGREIPCRYFEPTSGKSKGVLLHIHGGGWVLMSEASQDPYLKYMADHFELTIFSVGYRLAPEDPFPAGPNDCYDAAEWLIENSKEKFGGEVLFAGGESAGAHLVCLVALYLLDKKPSFSFKGLLLHFGCFDLSGFLPMVDHHELELVLDQNVIKAFIDAFLPNTTPLQRRDSTISPFFADIRSKKLPPALFTCGSEDPLLDDTVFMGAKWQAWGNEAVVRIFNGAPHGFIVFPPGVCEAVQEGLDVTEQFVREKLAA